MPNPKEILKDFKVIRIDVGDDVICDWCGKDWTDKQEAGGILYMSKAVCPTCVQNSPKLQSDKRYIRGKCPTDKSFADWVRQDLR